MNKIDLENFIIDELIKWSGNNEEGFQQVASRILEGILEEIIDDCPHLSIVMKLQGNHSDGGKTNVGVRERD